MVGRITKQDVKEQHDYADILGSEWVAGMEFVKFETDGGDVRYHPFHMDHDDVNRTPLTEIYRKTGGLAAGRTVDGREVAVDDDGIHY